MGAPSHRQCGAKRLFLHVSSTDSVFRWITAGTGARDGDVIYTRREYEYKKHVLCPWVEDDACPQMRTHTHDPRKKGTSSEQHFHAVVHFPVNAPNCNPDESN